MKETKEKKFDLAKKEPRKVFYVDFVKKELISIETQEIKNEKHITKTNDDEAALGLLR